MCEFVSWIEKDGKVLYLTDADVYSSFGRDQLQGVRDNDVLGHGAIRQYFDIVGGQQHERTIFWGRDVPKEIRDAIKRGAMTRMLRESMRIDEIANVVTTKPPAWALEAIKKTKRLRVTRRKAGTYCEVLAWYPSGQLSHRWRYKNGAFHGLLETWYSNGNPETCTSYKDGKLDGVCSSWWRSGQLRIREHYRNNGLHGLSEGWLEGGQLHTRMHHKNDQLHGQRECWWSSGKPRLCQTWKNGCLHGKYRRWDQTGAEMPTEYWSDGVLVTENQL
jgi:antitoxin component YwqK of YwqJK toxin-antitoxin module